MGTNGDEIHHYIERHCAPSGTVLGIGTAVTYLRGNALIAIDPPAVRACPLIWKLAKRLMKENFSSS